MYKVSTMFRLVGRWIDSMVNDGMGAEARTDNLLSRGRGRAQIGRSAADAAERLVAVEARERSRQTGGVAGAGDAGAGLIGRRPFDGFGDAAAARRAAHGVRAI